MILPCDEFLNNLYYIYDGKLHVKKVNAKSPKARQHSNKHITQPQRTNPHPNPREGGKKLTSRYNERQSGEYHLLKLHDKNFNKAISCKCRTTLIIIRWAHQPQSHQNAPREARTKNLSRIQPQQHQLSIWLLCLQEQPQPR